MITVYLYDNLGIFTHSEELDKMGPIPLNSLLEPPPELNEGEYAQREGDGWKVVTELPVAQPQPKYVPSFVSRAQGKAALIQMELWSDITAYVDSIADPTTKALAEVALNDTQEWQRASPFLNQCADAIGITPEQLDELFISASEIVL